MAIFQRRGGVSQKTHDITALDLGIMGLRHAAARAGDSSLLRKLT
jgi:hypothetical protein